MKITNLGISLALLLALALAARFTQSDKLLRASSTQSAPVAQDNTQHQTPRPLRTALD